MSANESDHVPNIGPRGATGRRMVGQIGVVASILVAIALFAFHAPRGTRVVLVLPLAAAAAGFLQARERT